MDKRDREEPEAKEGEEFEPGPKDRLDEREKQLGAPPAPEVSKRDDDNPPPLAA